MKGFHLFKCPCDAVNPIMESQLEFGRGEEKFERELVVKNAQFSSWEHHLVLRLCVKLPHEQQFAVTFACEEDQVEILLNCKLKAD